MKCEGLRVCEVIVRGYFGDGIALAASKRVKQVLCLSSELVEVWLFAESAGRLVSWCHNELLSDGCNAVHMPGVRLRGQKRVH
jgi:hypothetical protein